MFDHLDDTTRELLGIGRDDLWVYAAFAALTIGALAAGVVTSAAFAIATALFLRFLVRSTPRYWSNDVLTPVARTIGLLGNVAFLVLFAGVVVLKVRGLVPPL